MSKRGRFLKTTSLFAIFTFIFSISVIPRLAWCMDDGGMYGKVEMGTASKTGRSEIKVDEESPAQTSNAEKNKKDKTAEKVDKGDSLLGGLIRLTTAILVTVGGDSTSTNADTGTSSKSD